MFLLIQDADEDIEAQDIRVQQMKIDSIQTHLMPEEDIGIVIDRAKVLTTLGNFPRACVMLMGLIYSLNLAYPKELKY